MMTIDNMLEVLPTGEGKIVKKTKYGVWVQFGTVKIFINYSETFTNPDTWTNNKDE